jgi:hypothetical protein
VDAFDGGRDGDELVVWLFESRREMRLPASSYVYDVATVPGAVTEVSRLFRSPRSTAGGGSQTSAERLSHSFSLRLLPAVAEGTPVFQGSIPRPRELRAGFPRMGGEASPRFGHM